MPTTADEESTLPLPALDLYRLIAKNSPHVIGVFDRDLRFVLIEGTLLETLGTTQARLLGKALSELLRGDDYVQIRADFAAFDGVSATRTVRTAQHVFGVDISPLRDDNGTIRGGMASARMLPDQVRLEEALQDAEQRYYTLFENSLDAIMLTEPSGLVLMANPAACTMFGYSEEEIIKFGRAGLLDMTDPALPVALEARRLHGEARADLRAIRANGEVFQTEVTSKVFMGVDGRMKTCTIIRDMSERKRAEQALRESEERLRQLAENVRAVFWLSSPDLQKFHYISPACETVLGYPPQFFIENAGRLILHVHPEDRQRVGAAFRDITKIGSGIEYRAVHPDGSVRWIWSTASFVHNERGEITGIAGLVKDITERKSAEKALEESHQFMEQTAAALPAVLFVHDLLTDRNVYANRETLTMLGYTPQAIQIMGNQFWGTLIHPDDALAIRARDKNFFAASDTEVMSQDFRIKHADGSWRWVNTRSVVFKRRNDGTPWQVLGIMQDITDQRNAEEQARAIEVDRERIAILNNFIRDVSHEFRTPLTVINSSAYLMRRLESPELRAEQQQKITTQVDHLETMLNAMLTMSRLDSLRVLEFAPVAVNTLVQTLLDSLSDRLQQHNLRLNAALDPAIPLVSLDETDMSTALLNIFDNAIQNTPSGGYISVTTALDGQNVHIGIADTGIGIPESDMPHIFERMYRVDKARTTGNSGPGLGLSIARRIIELHGGQIAVESHEGDGTRCSITLPISRAAS